MARAEEKERGEPEEESRRMKEMRRL